MTKAEAQRATSLAGPRDEIPSALSRDSEATPRLVPSSRLHEEIPRDLPAELVAEYRAVLSELDWLVATLGVPPEPETAAPERPTPVQPRPISRARSERPEPAPQADPDERWGVPSPYLDERLAAARALAATLSNEFGRMERRTQVLRESAASVEAELARATEELAFLRSNGGFDGPSDDDDDEPTAVVPRGGPAPTAASGRVAAPAATDPDRAPAFGEFTVARYDATVRDTQSRHGRVAALTVVLAVAISGVLLTLTYYSHEVMPVWWLAILPVVWMIPVPFFLVSFRSTHRLLRRERLELSEAA
jgi:hypothetical protein